MASALQRGRTRAAVLVAVALVSSCTSSSSHPSTARPRAPASTSTTPPSPPSATRPWNVWSLRMLSPGDGWGLLGRGTRKRVVARTTDGAATWHAISPPKRCGEGLPGGGDLDNAWLGSSLTHGVREHGLATICHSTDGGVTWRRVGQFHTTGQVGIPQFVDDRHGWITSFVTGGMHSPGDVRLYRTDDAGRHWREVAARVSGLYGGHSFGGLPSTCGGNIRFVDRGTGWYAGGCSQGGIGEGSVNTWEAAVAVTHDGGSSWQTVRLPHPRIRGSRAGCRLNAACVYDFVMARRDTVELVAGGAGTKGAFLYRTADGGRRWQVKQLPAGTAAVGSADGRHLMQLDPHHGDVYLSGDAGQTWHRTPANLPAPGFEGPYVTGGGAAFAFLLHNRPLYRTHDGGHRWQPVSVRLAGSPPVRLCRTGDLAAVFSGGGFGTGNDFGSLIIWNHSPARCELSGVPKFSAYYRDGRRDRHVEVNEPWRPLHIVLPGHMPAFVRPRGLAGYVMAVLIGPERDDPARRDGTCREADKRGPARLILELDAAVVNVRNRDPDPRSDVDAVFGCHGRVLLGDVRRIR